MNLVVFSTNLDWDRTKNGVICDSIRCSIPNRGLLGVFSWVVFGHNSGGRSGKTSFMALLNDQTSASESESESLVSCNTFYSN